MRITRFVDRSGRTVHGEELGDGTARLLIGELFDGLTPTDRIVPIARRLAPLVPSNIFGIGLNYRAHAAEAGFEPPATPVVFMKPTSTLNHPDAPIVLPACCPEPEVDYEAELAVVIGRAARDVSEADALDHVLGYTVANDLSARTWQLNGAGGQWIRGKSFDGFCPLGPVLVTADEIPDPQTLMVTTRLNGERLQHQSSADMIFPVRRLISELSRDLTLLPGTVILTGTPEGVGFTRTPPIFLQPGDEVTVEVESIGALSNVVVAG